MPSLLYWRVKLWLPPFNWEWWCWIMIGKFSTLWLSSFSEFWPLYPMGDIDLCLCFLLLADFYSSWGKSNSALSGPIIELWGGLLFCFCSKFAVSFLLYSKCSSAEVCLLLSVAGWLVCCVYCSYSRWFVFVTRDEVTGISSDWIEIGSLLSVMAAWEL